MEKKIMRTFISFTAFFPLSVVLTYCFLDQLTDWLRHAAPLLVSVPSWGVQGAIMALVVLLNVFVGWVSARWIEFMMRRMNPNRFNAKTVKECGDDRILEYLPYLLPLFIHPSSPQGLGGWILGAIMLLWLTSSYRGLQYSPLLRLFGFRFYDVVTSGGYGIVVISKHEISGVAEAGEAVRLTENCYLIK
jgi:hypothetical protein